jgi:hypothetical protein
VRHRNNQYQFVSRIGSLLIQTDCAASGCLKTISLNCHGHLISWVPSIYAFLSSLIYLLGQSNSKIWTKSLLQTRNILTEVKAWETSLWWVWCDRYQISLFSKELEWNKRLLYFDLCSEALVSAATTTRFRSSVKVSGNWLETQRFIDLNFIGSLLIKCTLTKQVTRNLQWWWCWVISSLLSACHRS